MRKVFLVLSIALFLFSCNKEVTFTAPNEVTVGSDVNIKYSKSVSSTKGNQCWISIVKEESPVGAWGVWKYVNDKAKSDVLVAPEVPGKYEIRMYDNYPKESHHLIATQKLEIK